MMRAAVLTVSDSCFRGERKDLSGPAVLALLTSNGFLIERHGIVPDEESTIADWLVSACSHSELVVTTGGTGLAPRDVTPEATQKVCDRMVDGISEQMRAEGRKQTPYSALSRALCGTRGTSLLLNLPGSPRGAVASLEAVLPMLKHALIVLSGSPVPHESTTHSIESMKDAEIR